MTLNTHLCRRTTDESWCQVEDSAIRGRAQLEAIVKNEALEPKARAIFDRVQRERVNVFTQWETRRWPVIEKEG